MRIWVHRQRFPQTSFALRIRVHRQRFPQILFVQTSYRPTFLDSSGSKRVACSTCGHADLRSFACISEKHSNITMSCRVWVKYAMAPKSDMYKACNSGPKILWLSISQLTVDHFPRHLEVFCLIKCDLCRDLILIMSDPTICELIPLDLQFTKGFMKMTQNGRGLGGCAT